MNNETFANILVEIHNKLTEISVKGEDAIRMSDIIRGIRGTVAEIQKDLAE